MHLPTNILTLAQNMQKELAELDALYKTTPTSSGTAKIFDELVTNKTLHKKTEKLFKDGHHARAVEEAYKLLDNVVKTKANLRQSNLSGSSLMQKVFTPNKPILRMNAGATVSEQDEQNGYMQIYAGCMTGIRNPRAHDSDWEDTEDRALQLIVFANHLIERAQLSELSGSPTTD